MSWLLVKPHVGDGGGQGHVLEGHALPEEPHEDQRREAGEETRDRQAWSRSRGAPRLGLLLVVSEAPGVGALLVVFEPPAVVLLVSPKSHPSSRDCSSMPSAVDSGARGSVAWFGLHRGAARGHRLPCRRGDFGLLRRGRRLPRGRGGFELRLRRGGRRGLRLRRGALVGAGRATAAASGRAVAAAARAAGPDPASSRVVPSAPRTRITAGLPRGSGTGARCAGPRCAPPGSRCGP